ncbi:sensor histidine kinase [Paracoccus sp. (in: a-proteobacteria)]|uniref:sensor histidine kinase n=1 Tax=Paracoccus sp. TaxID=267 RepID=UPI003A835656
MNDADFNTMDSAGAAPRSAAAMNNRRKDLRLQLRVALASAGVIAAFFHASALTLRPEMADPGQSRLFATSLSVMFLAFLGVLFLGVISARWNGFRPHALPVAKVDDGPLRAVIWSREYFSRLTGNAGPKGVAPARDPEPGGAADMQVLILKRVLAATGQSLRHFDMAGNFTDYGANAVGSMFLARLPAQPVASAAELWAVLQAHDDLERGSDAGDAARAGSVLYRLEILVEEGQVFDICLLDLGPAGRAYLVSDVTVARFEEEQRQNAHTLEVLGSLAGGVAHDFNNVLAAIGGNLELMEDRVEDDPFMRQRIDSAMRAARRARAQTTSLAAFSQRQADFRERVFAGDLVRETLEIAQEMVVHSCKVITDPVPDVQLKVASANVVSALIHLVVNARNAMVNGGEIRIGGRELPGGEAVGLGLDSARRYVEIHVVDQGTGVADEIMDDIMKEFFTTKAPGCAAGLGLPMARRTAEREGGKLRFWNNPEGGATFAMILPCVS